MGKGGNTKSSSNCFTIFLALVVVVLSIAWATNPSFPSYILFSYDHLKGRFGFQPDGLYHCVNNRFDATTNYDELVVESDSSTVMTPPTIQAKDYTPELMKELSDNYRLPVVIKGLFSDTVAGKTWTHEHFSKKYGNQSIIYHDLSFPITHITSSFQRQESPTTLEKYIKSITEDGAKQVLGNDHYMMLDYPELIEELELKKWDKFDGMPVLPLSLRMFMGGKDTGVGWHAATSHNLFIEVRGKKLFKWFPPSTRLHHLHPTLSNKLPAVEHCEGHYYPKGLKTYEVVLESGDACFTPAWLWHATRHLEPTIAVGLRMESFLHDIKSAPFLSWLAEFSSDIPGVPFFNALTRASLQGAGIRLQGQPLTQHEKDNGYKWDWLRDYMQAGGKLASEEQKDSQWKL